MTTEQASTKRTGGCSFTFPYGEETISYTNFISSLEHAKWALEHGGWSENIQVRLEFLEGRVVVIVTGERPEEATAT